MIPAVIAAAGRGSRAYPKTSRMPKVLLEFSGKSLIARNIELLRDQMGITDITIIDGYLKEQIRAALGDGSRLGVKLRYVTCPEPDKGLAVGLLSVRDLMNNGPFVLLLGDELYLNTNHRDLRPDGSAVCGLMHVDDLHLIKKNYSVDIHDGAICQLIEKPETVPNDLLGCGTFVFTPEIFAAIDATPPSARSGRVELIDAIDRLARSGPVVKPFMLEGSYFNINSIDDYNYAQFRFREADFASRRISIVIPAYNEESSIAHVVRDFLPHAAEVLVVNNSSRDRTAEVAAAAGARVVNVSLTGYGDTIRHGLDVAIGDILVVVEADFSFRARDLSKLLEYLKDADMVIGTRTTRELVEQGTNMRGPVRWGNVLVAKMVEVMWWGQQPRFTDVGCTYRVLWRETYRAIRPLLHGVGPELSPEMMIAALRARKRIIEVPVSYHRRIGGESKHSANYYRISRTALRMLKTIFRHFFSSDA